MAHFAKIENGLVTQVIVVGDEYENMYSEWRKEFGENWVQTSFNAATNGFRFNYAGIGFTYNKDLDAFISPKCHNEATLNNKCQWDCTNTDHDTKEMPFA
jgi:hypothetical protein